VEQPADVLHVLAAGEPFLDRRVLAGEPDSLPDAVRMLGDVDAVDERLAGVGPQERGEHPHGRGLAGTIGPEQPVDRASRYL
jgi:hypothetical protein